MPATFQALENATLPAGKIGKAGRGFSWATLFLPILIAWFLFATPSLHAAQDFSIVQVPGGIGFTGGYPNYQTSFGTMDALAIGGATQPGVSVIALNNGALYYSTFKVTVTGGVSGAQTAYFEAAVTTNFTHTAAMVVESCPSTSVCNTSGVFSVMSTNIGAPTVVVPTPGLKNGQSATIGVAIFVPDNDGASAYSGTDSATFAIGMLATSNNALLDFDFIGLPSQTVQTAVRLNVATAPSGLTVNPAADYAMNYGNVNALGIGPSAGLTIVAAAGGIIYSTPYQLLPAFSDLTSTNATIKTYVSTDFAHPTILQLNDAALSAGPYTAFTKSAGTATQIGNAFTNRSTNTRYLGLFVSNANGATAFTGTDNATLTYTLTVP